MNRRFRTSPRLTWSLVALILISCAGWALSFHATRVGIGISPDSAKYVAAARSLLAGHGFMIPAADGGARPMVQWPPLFPALLAFFALLGVEPLSGARWLNTLLFGVNIFLVAMNVRAVASRAAWPALLAAALALGGIEMLNVHTMAWTEPLFIAATLTTFLFLCRYATAGRRLYLVISALAAAVAMLTRYSGAAVIATGLAGIVLVSDQKPLRRVRDALIFAAISCIPAAFWLFRLAGASAGVGGRPLAWHLAGIQRYVSAADVCSLWFLPGRIPASVRLPLFVLAGAAVCVLCLRPRRSSAGSSRDVEDGCEGRAVRLYLLFLIAYPAFVFASLSAVDLSIMMDMRIAAPLFAVCLVPVAFALDQLMQIVSRRRAAAAALCVVLVLLLSLHLGRGFRWTAEFCDQGRGYAAREWRLSPTMALARTLPAATPIISNRPEAFYILLGRNAADLPHKLNIFDRTPNQNYLQELEAARRLLLRGGVLVFFADPANQPYLPPPDELVSRLDLALLAKEDDALVYCARTALETLRSSRVVSPGLESQAPAAPDYKRSAPSAE